MNKLLQIISLIMLMQACGESNWRERRDLDPDTAEEVKRINLEKYSGNWHATHQNGAFYLSLSEEGFYWTLEDAHHQIIGGDFGEVKHHLPGKMLLYSQRSECETAHYAQYLFMEQTSDSVLMRSKEDSNFAIKLVPVDKRERIANLPCGIYPR